MGKIYPPSISGMRITASKIEADWMIDDFDPGVLPPREIGRI
jgi:hypothetical protein